MDEILYYSSLYDVYKRALTPKQRSTFTDYFFENLTLDEIASNNGISKNAVSKTILGIKNTLVELESKMHLLEYIKSLKSEFKNEEDILQRIDKYDNIIM